MQQNITLKHRGIGTAGILFGVVLAVNIAQSVLTPLLNDEPYYWLYSKYPAWGYFDHPPMIAFLIRAGYGLLPGEIGVRLFTAILGSLTFLLVYKIIEGETDKPVNFKLACLLLVSSLFLNLYSFLAIPDTPMLFFAALFLLCYRRYLKADSIINALLLGMVTALLLYSKYHGVLLVGFTLLSNVKLVVKRSFYVALFAALLLYLPHLYWQLQNDFPTIRFQFSDRANEFSLQHVISYVSEQAGITGPVILLLFSILYKPKNQFQRSLQFNTAGIFVFFLISSFKEMVNIHWTAIAWPGMLCLAYLYIDGLKKNRTIVWSLLALNLAIVIILRFNFVFDVFRISNFNDKNPRLMTTLLKDSAKHYPKVFIDMYNEPAYFYFYRGDTSFAINTIGYKKTQYNYLPQLEQKFQGKTVDLISGGPVNGSSKKIIIPKGKTYFITTVADFASFNTGISVQALNFNQLKASAQNNIRLVIKSTLSPAAQQLLAQKHGYLLLTLVNNSNKQSFSFRYPYEPDVSGKAPLTFSFKAPALKGAYKAVFSLVTPDLNLPGFNSNIYSCKIE